MRSLPGALDGGIFRVVNGAHHFLRLRPDPVFLREEAGGACGELEDTPDDPSAPSGPSSKRGVSRATAS